MNTATCGQCGLQIQYPDEYAGRKARCSKCNSPVLLGPGASDQSAHVSSMRIRAVTDDAVAGPAQSRRGPIGIGLVCLIAVIGAAYLLLRAPEKAEDSAPDAPARAAQKTAARPSATATKPAGKQQKQQPTKAPSKQQQNAYVAQWNAEFQPLVDRANVSKNRLSELGTAMRRASAFLLRVRSYDKAAFRQVVTPLQKQFGAEFETSLRASDTRQARGWSGLIAMLDSDSKAAATREVRCRRTDLKLLLVRPTLEADSDGYWLRLSQARGNLDRVQTLRKRLGSKQDPDTQRLLTERTTLIRQAYSKLIKQTLDRLSAKVYGDVAAVREGSETCRQVRLQLEQSAQFVLSLEQTKRFTKQLSVLQRRLAKARVTPESSGTKKPDTGPKPVKPLTVADFLQVANPLLDRLDLIWGRVDSKKIRAAQAPRESAADHRLLLKALLRLPESSRRQTLTGWVDYAGQGTRMRTLLAFLSFIGRSEAGAQLRGHAKPLEAKLAKLAKKLALNTGRRDVALEALEKLDPLAFVDPFKRYSIRLPKGWMLIKRKPRRFAQSRERGAPSLEIRMGQARRLKTLTAFFKKRGSSYARGAAKKTQLSKKLLRLVDRSGKGKLEAIYLTQLAGHRGYCELRFRCTAKQAAALLPLFDATAGSLRVVPSMRKWQAAALGQLTLLKPELPGWAATSMALHSQLDAFEVSYLEGKGLLHTSGEKKQTEIRVNWFGGTTQVTDSKQKKYNAGSTSLDAFFNEMWATLRATYKELPARPAVQRIRLGQVVARATPFYRSASWKVRLRLIVAPGKKAGQFKSSDKYAIVVTSQEKYHLRNAEVIDAILRSITIK